MSGIELPADQRAESAFATLRRGLRMMPEFRRGLPVTFLLALIATAGRVVVPIAVQQTIDKGLSGPDGPDLDLVRTLVLVCAVVVVITAVAVYRMNVRLFRTTETALADEVVWIEHGRVLARGTHEELLAEVPGYAALVRAYQEAGEVAA